MKSSKIFVLAVLLILIGPKTAGLSCETMDNFVIIVAILGKAIEFATKASKRQIGAPVTI